MRIESDVLLEKYVTFDKPVPYKDFNIYPIQLQDWYDIKDIIGILEIDKNTLGQIELITMSNLRFVLTFASMEDKYIDELNSLLKLALHLSKDEETKVFLSEDKEYLEIGKPINYNGSQLILDKSTSKIITSEDFDEIKRIILYQNLIDYTDRYIDPDVKREAEEYYRLKNKGGVNVPLEHKIICVQMKTGMSTEAIGKLTIRKFLQLFQTVVEENEYNLNKIAECQGAKFKKPIEHWAYKERKDKYAEAFCDADNFLDEVQSVN